MLPDIQVATFAVFVWICRHVDSQTCLQEEDIHVFLAELLLIDSLMHGLRSLSLRGTVWGTRVLILQAFFQVAASQVMRISSYLCLFCLRPSLASPCCSCSRPETCFQA